MDKLCDDLLLDILDRVVPRCEGYELVCWRWYRIYKSIPYLHVDLRRDFKAIQGKAEVKLRLFKENVCKMILHGGNTDFSWLSGMSSTLQVLILDTTRYIHFDELSCCPKLRRLDIRNNRGGQHYSALLPSLEICRLERVDTITASLESLVASCPNLKELFFCKSPGGGGAITLTSTSLEILHFDAEIQYTQVMLNIPSLVKLHICVCEKLVLNAPQLSKDKISYLDQLDESNHFGLLFSS